MNKYDIIEKALKVCLGRETKPVFSSNLCIEKVELMLEKRWNNSYKLE